MAMKTLHANIILILLAAAVVLQSNSEGTPQVIYQKLEDALIADKSVLYLMQQVFFPSQSLSRDLVYLNVCVTAGNVRHESCDNPSLLGGQRNFTYCQYFQWSSSALVNLISINQLFVLDNVICQSVIRTTFRWEHLVVSLHTDALPCETTQGDILRALMQLLPWVCISYLYA